MFGNTVTTMSFYYFSAINNRFNHDAEICWQWPQINESKPLKSPGMIIEWTVPDNEKESTAFISLKLVSLYGALIFTTCDTSRTVNRLIMPRQKVKGRQR